MKISTAKEGSALVLCVAFVVLTSMLSGAVLYAGMSHYRLANRQTNLEKALYVAEGGLEIAANYLSKKSGFAGDYYTASGTISDGSYQYAMSNIAWRTYTITAQGTVDGISRSVSIDRAWLPTYAEYALWMNENGQIYFKSGETFFGAVHSNDKLWFSGNSSAGGPTFWDAVSSSSSTYGGSLDYVTFHEGFELNAAGGNMAEVDFDSTDWASLNNLAQNYGMLLKGTTSITLDGDQILVTNPIKGWSDHAVTLGADQIIYVEDSVTTSITWRRGRPRTTTTTVAGKVTMNGGTLDGELTVVAEDDIIINDHIRYADDPSDDVSGGVQSDDSLGLVAMDDVWVSTSAPNNLDLYAAIMATGEKSSRNDGSFGVLDYDEGSPRGSLNVYGSIIQDVRGAVGQFSTRTGAGVHGYDKNYAFDERFKDAPPPYYPAISSEVRFEGWEDAAL